MAYSQIPAIGAVWRVRGESASDEGRAVSFVHLAQAVSDGDLGESDEVRAPGETRWTAVGDHPALEDHLPPSSLLRAHAYDEADMDMTPMIDVTFQLLIFFMITACFVVQKTLDMPGGGKDESRARRYSLAQLQEHNVIVTIRSQGDITVDGKPADLATVGQAIQEAASTRSNPEVVLDADDTVEHETVVAVIDAAAGVQIEKVHFLRHPSPSRSQPRNSQ